MTTHILGMSAAAALLAACTSHAPVEALGRGSEPIIGGKIDDNDPAVVLLISYPQDESTFYTCTASVIAPTLLLTAAHCVDAPSHPGYSFGAFLGPDASAFATVAALKPQLVAAKSAIAHPQYDANASNYPADIGVVILSSSVQATPLPIELAALDAGIAGEPSRIVGYGETKYQQYNARKYEAATTVVGLDPDGHTVVVGDAAHHTCIGDSGGPALVMMGGHETIIGVDSFTPSVGCVEPSHFQRVDTYQAFVNTYLEPGTGGSGGGTVMTTSSSVASSASAGVGAGGGEGTGGAAMGAPATPVADSGGGCTASPSAPKAESLWLLALVSSSTLFAGAARRVGRAAALSRRA